MGSGPSRGKKVAPACISEVNVTKTTAGVPSPKQDSRIFKPLKIHAVLRNARNRAQPDCHSQGPDSDFSGEDEDIDAELDTVLADYEERERITAKKQPPKKTFMKSKTYGLCHLGREDTEDEVSAAPRLSASGGAEEPRVPRGGSEDVNKRSNDAFTHLKKPTVCTSQHNSSSSSSSSSRGFLKRGSPLDSVPTSEKQSTFGSCHSSSLTMPVILYDGSEEKLMDTIEREFS
ncbi:uncharacterized protein LOC117756412 [Hippoglossus hippoglossus]|uniref:uncharacterized protein LOC117756412 n=1 Tax=Hippoglossus hippoglossus TaxID=8267 RepID=UPI00148E733E|nr:uncharacterized protein LOC117756412 [Hippoglossus hippoglossus]XP_035024665.1 uncharacterized protein LOC118116843 [Hippoglossus stenolepis]